MDFSDRDRALLTAQLLHLYEEFSNFHGDCQVICEALNSLAASQKFVGGEEYVNQVSQALTQKGSALKQELKQAYQWSYTDSQAVKKTVDKN